MFHTLPPSLRRALRDGVDRFAPSPGPPPAAPGAAATREAPDPCQPPGPDPGADPVALDQISLRDHARVWSAVTEARPSYVYKLHEARRRNLLVRDLGSAHPMWAVNSKTQGYRFATAMGVEVPRPVASFDDISHVDPGVLGDRFLVKPVQGSTNRGVFGLVVEGEGRYRDLMSGATSTWPELRDRYLAQVRKGSISRAGMVEELLASPDGSGAIPDDWKVYVFGGRAAVTMQRRMNGTADRSQWRFRFWTREWADLGAVKFHDRLDPTLPPPEHRDDLVSAADRLGAALDLPFVRLDFYDTDRGVVFGEVSLHPGPPEVWDPAVDEALGRHWELVEARHAVRDIEAGRWSDLERFR